MQMFLYINTLENKIKTKKLLEMNKFSNHRWPYIPQHQKKTPQHWRLYSATLTESAIAVSTF